MTRESTGQGPPQPDPVPRPKPMPQPDPVPKADVVPPPRLLMLKRFRRIMRWMALLAVVVAAIAVLLVARGDQGVHIHMLIATALGAGLSVLLGAALMTLTFLSSSSGHDDQATGSGGDGHAGKDEDRP